MMDFICTAFSNSRERERERERERCATLTFNNRWCLWWKIYNKNHTYIYAYPSYLYYNLTGGAVGLCIRISAEVLFVWKFIRCVWKICVCSNVPTRTWGEVVLWRPANLAILPPHLWAWQGSVSPHSAKTDPPGCRRMEVRCCQLLRKSYMLLWPQSRWWVTLLGCHKQAGKRGGGEG